MIWAIVTKEEMEGYKIPPVFQYYREVVGKENIKLAVVDEDDKLEFLEEDDIVLLRTASERIISKIQEKKIKTTAEDFSTYELVKDKKEVGNLLMGFAIPVPKQYKLDEVKDGETYFVKPRFGGESFGITKESICHTKNEVIKQVKYVQDTCNQEAVIDEFIDGVDCTVACYYSPKEKKVKSHAIGIECEEVGGIQTHKGKFDYNECCSAITGVLEHKLKYISQKTFKKLQIKHHARIDFRVTGDGRIYLIDINLLPGLGPSAHFAKCLLLTNNMSYKDAIWSIINSASK